ncbi:hypothetical protein M431DRAFT_490319 [Trichoderma harzianum CBS 226.95]|uniref:Secreted protein n=1 Tax=Trichoderma harzianum CBS 226.95 TaxID=983964 RepID=A0A2T4ANQ6_TRIHA|nr:hypothetical protein M431DRAFT_490319 [Trichoderma harzianum CBS 226.95]PTB58699.1 hypothetical protein M431DRAFT_490319 [Trichoderma harzianum CBS 226.95]
MAPRIPDVLLWTWPILVLSAVQLPSRPLARVSPQRKPSWDKQRWNHCEIQWTNSSINHRLHVQGRQKGQRAIWELTRILIFLASFVLLQLRS